MADQVSDESLDDLVRLTNESVALQALALRLNLETKAEFIVMLSQAGFENARIASFLGDTTASVRSAVNRSKKVNG